MSGRRSDLRCALENGDDVKKTEKRNSIQSKSYVSKGAEAATSKDKGNALGRKRKAERGISYKDCGPAFTVETPQND